MDNEVEWLTQLDESDCNDETLQMLLAGHCIFLRALLALGLNRLSLQIQLFVSTDCSRSITGGVDKSTLIAVSGEPLAQVLLQQHLFAASFHLEALESRRAGFVRGIPAISAAAAADIDSNAKDASVTGEDEASAGHTLSGSSASPRESWCVARTARLAALALVVELCRDCAPPTVLVANALQTVHNTVSATLGQWEFAPNTSARGSFVGLKNAGATCYINSLLQQFFMHTGVRNAVLAVPDSTEQAWREKQPAPFPPPAVPGNNAPAHPGTSTFYQVCRGFYSMVFG